MRIKNYFKNAYKSGLDQNLELEQKILSNMSLSLKEEMIFEDKGKILMKIPFFKNNFSY